MKQTHHEDPKIAMHNVTSECCCGPAYNYFMRNFRGAANDHDLIMSLEEARSQRCSENPEEAVIVASARVVCALDNSARLTSLGLHCVSKHQEGLNGIHGNFLGLS